MSNVITPQLDGTFVKSSKNETLNDVAVAEQIIREHLVNNGGMMLLRVEPLAFGDRKIMLAHVVGMREPSTEEIAQLEASLREQTGEAAYALAFSTFHKTLNDTDGLIRYGWIPGKQATPAIRERIRDIRADLEAEFAADDLFLLVNISATQLDGKLHLLLEIVGPDVYPRQQVDALHARLTEKYAEPIALYAWSRIEVVHAPQGSMSFAQVQRYFSDRQKENLPQELSMILEASGR